MEDDDIDDIFDEEVEKSKEIKPFLSIKQETPFNPEDTGLPTNIASHTNEKMLDIKSENFYEEINDNFEIKLEELDGLKIEAEDIKQICNKNIKSFKNKYYICVICQKRFPSASRRNNHLGIHFDIPVETKNGKSRSRSGFFGKEIFVCGFCGQFHLNKIQILNHCQQYYVKNRRNIGYNRKKTNSALDNINVFNSEVKLETEGDNSVNNMQLLGCRLPAGKLSNKNSLVNQSRRFNCNRCNRKTFSNKTDLEKHLQTHDKYKCKICAKEYRVKTSLMVHMFNHKKDTFKLNQNSTPYVICHICSKFFADKHALRYHLISHTDMRKYNCKHCSKCYKYEQDLKRHMDCHTGREIQLFKCCHCHKGFKQKGHLKRHIEGHFLDGSKNYKCEICAKSYKWKESLHSHLRVHNGVKYVRKHLTKPKDPFECKQCGKKFVYNNSLVRHIKRTHERQRYICNLCNKSYYREDYLKTHMDTCTRKKKKIVAKQDPSECKQCGKIFKHRANLQRHVKHVHGGQRYICALCNKSYNRKDDLKAHLESHKENKN